MPQAYRMDKKLIERVCERELLYAVDSPHYRDRALRAVAWSEIGKDLGLPALQCKDMWRKLRNCYLNAINRRQNKNIPKWKFEDEMSFLLPYIEVKTPENDIEMLMQSPSLSFHDINPDTVLEDSSEMILPETSTYSGSGKQQQQDGGGQQHADDDMSESGALMSGRKNRGGVPSLYNGRTSSHWGMSSDETEMFFLSISETVKRLPAIDQARIKMEVCKLVFLAEIRQLETDYS